MYLFEDLKWYNYLVRILGKSLYIILVDIYCSKLVDLKGCVTVIYMKTEVIRKGPWQACQPQDFLGTADLLGSLLLM